MVVGSGTLDTVMNKIGSWVMINIGSEILNTRGDGSYLFTQFSGVGYVQVLNDTDTSTEFGVADQGDAVGYFRMHSSFPPGSRIIVSHQGIDYEWTGEQILPHISGNQLLKIVNLRRFQQQLAY